MKHQIDIEHEIGSGKSAEEGGARRERRAAKRRSEILDAAIRVFSRMGFEASSTRAIAAEADVSEGTLYNYFEDKDALLISALEHVSGLPLLQSTAANSSSSQSITELFKAFGAERSKALAPVRMAFVGLLLETLRNPRVRKQYADRLVLPGIDAIAALLRERRKAQEIEVADIDFSAKFVLAASIGMSIIALLDEELAEFMTHEPEKSGERLFELVCLGLGVRQAKRGRRRPRASGKGRK